MRNIKPRMASRAWFEFELSHLKRILLNCRSAQWSLKTEFVVLRVRQTLKGQQFWLISKRGIKTSAL